MQKLLITIPCFNEDLVLKKNVEIIYQYAQKNFPGFAWQILIIDNASQDNTWQAAQEIKSEKGEKIILDQEFDKGRGVALRKAWQKFPGYDIYSYMDADLAADLKDFKDLVDKVCEGFDFVTGSRYLSASDVERNFKREFLSRIYNLILKVYLGVRFKDAQCGFKAFSRKLAAELVPQTQDGGWFWDTELMILAYKYNYKVLEIPVSWREVRDELRASKVSHWSEIKRQLNNIYKMKQRLRNLKK